jgi:hypothetical protein
MHSSYIKTLIKVLKARKLDVNFIFDNSGIKEEDLEKELNLTAQQLDTISTHAIEMSNDRQLGLLVGSNIDIPSQGIFGYAIITSTTIGDALKLLVRYNKALLPSLDVKMLSRESRVEVIIKAPHLPDDLERFYIELLYAAIMRSGNTLIPKGRASVYVEFDYDAPYDKTPYQQLFGSKVQFNSDKSVLSFDEASLDLGIVTANPVIIQRYSSRYGKRTSTRSYLAVRDRIPYEYACCKSITHEREHPSAALS